MQLNTGFAGKPNGIRLYGDALGTHLGPGDPFNGDVFANIVTGAAYLASPRLRNHPERYVGTDSSRSSMLRNLMPKMQDFFDCILKGMGLKK